MFKSYLSWFHTSFLSLCDKDVLFGFNLKMITPALIFLSPPHSLSGQQVLREDESLNLTPQAMRNGQTVSQHPESRSSGNERLRVKTQTIL